MKKPTLHYPTYKPEWAEDRVEAAQIPLSGDHVALVDAADLSTVSKFKWSAAVRGRRIYAQRSRKHGDPSLLHRFIMINAGLLSQRDEVDHVNGNGLDNRRRNLRASSRTQNLANMLKRRVPCSSRYKGVWFFRRHGLWMAGIQFKGQRHHLGYFASEHEAAMEYDFAAKAIFGRFPYTNFFGE